MYEWKQASGSYYCACLKVSVSCFSVCECYSFPWCHCVQRGVQLHGFLHKVFYLWPPGIYSATVFTFYLWRQENPGVFYSLCTASQTDTAPVGLFFILLFFFFFHCHCHCSLNQASGTIKDVWQNSIQTPWLHTLVANYWRCMPTELRLNLYTSPPPALVRTTLHTWTATSQKYTPTLFHSFLCHITSSKQVHSFFFIPICLNCIDLFRQDPCPLNRHSFNPSSCPLWVHHQQSYPLGDRL